MADYFKIQGQGRRAILKGEIPVYGAKNAALKAFAASLLFKDGLTIKNVPDIEDIRSVAKLVSLFGVPITKHGASVYELGPRKGKGTKLNKELSRKIRASIVLSGPVLGRYGEVVCYYPGGCMIGKRPIDQYLDGFRLMGAKVKEVEKDDAMEISIKAPRGGLSGAKIFMKNPSVSGTETIMMAAILANGTTFIQNAAMEPEIKALADFLSTCGAKIEGAGTSVIRIEGNGLLESKGRPYLTIPDRIEAGSFIILSALIGSDVLISNCNPSHLSAILHIMECCGVNLEVGNDYVRVRSSKKPYSHKEKNLSVKTHEYPGFPTDLQAPLTAFLTQVEGDSSIFETVFESRLEYISDISKMGGSIVPVSNNQVIIHGRTDLIGREMEAKDLRSGMAFLILGLIGKGESLVMNAYNIDRGYAKIEERLHKVGAKIERVSNEGKGERLKVG